MAPVRTLLMVILLGARVAAAQATVVGTVDDSLNVEPSRRAGPLRGATVVLAELGRESVADARGMFRFEGVPAGTYTLSFFHPLLDSLDLAAPRRSVEVPPAGRVSVRLAVPRGASIYAQLCGATPGDTLGVIVGRVRAAADGAAVTGATVTTTWSELTVGAGRTRQRAYHTTAVSGDRGVFVLCRVPTDIVADITVSASGFTAGPVPVNVSETGVGHADLLLPRAAGDTGTVRGIVIDQRGKPAENALVSIAGLERRTRSAADGRFALVNVPAGTRALEVRRIGTEPTVQIIHVMSDSTLGVNVTLGRGVQLLAATTIRTASSREASGFALRRRGALGEYLTGDEMRRRGFVRISESMFRFNGLSAALQPQGGQWLFTMRNLTGAPCIPRYYVDGFLWPEWGNPFDDIDLMRPRDILGIEVYRAQYTPPNYPPDPRTGCGVILIWRR
ncbi:MAG: carboxypeptidase regulatory-like domain-containing protein [Gemmatimonadota bacterium]